MCASPSCLRRLLTSYFAFQANHSRSSAAASARLAVTMSRYPSSADLCVDCATSNDSRASRAARSLSGYIPCSTWMAGMANGASCCSAQTARVHSRRSFPRSGRNSLTFSNSDSSASSCWSFSSICSRAGTVSSLAGSLFSSSSMRSNTSERYGTMTPSSTSACHRSRTSSSCLATFVCARFMSIIFRTNAKVGSSGESPVGSSPASSAGCARWSAPSSPSHSSVRLGSSASAASSAATARLNAPRLLCPLPAAPRHPSPARPTRGAAPSAGRAPGGRPGPAPPARSVDLLRIKSWPFLSNRLCLLSSSRRRSHSRRLPIMKSSQSVPT
mmetsp:Transcript_95263/g.293820  ORF Transcript_95263/g.293820 Transcript_95263/m.293820 type:complete len:329 (+) Transcript_95263:478-1464(+)